MVRTTNPDCRALGCDWDWGTDPTICHCGIRHTYRICTRCLTPDNDLDHCAAHDTSDTERTADSAGVAA